jgi:hypothetical protein
MIDRQTGKKRCGYVDKREKKGKTEEREWWRH